MKLIKQNHHIVYRNENHKQADVIVTVYKGEHWAITQLQRRKNISKGFIKALKYWLLLNEEKAVDL